MTMWWAWLISWLHFFTLTTDHPGQGQVYPKDYFRPPVDITMYLAGDFGELRANHFHSGIDIKTEGHEGLPVYAVADGYVSRINVSPYGYGKAVYIDHPNGFTSVYGHLSEFKGTLKNAVERYQREQESFAIEVYPDPIDFPVKKGDLIALSGNTGGSAGPHLHFEIRDTKTEEVINPLLFGFDIKDNLAPTATRLYVYGFSRGQRHLLPKSYPIYGDRVKDTILVDDPIAAVGIDAYDQFNGASNHNGVYAFSMLMGDRPWFYYDFERFGFNETRYVNALVDYCQYEKNHNRYYRLFRLPGNLLSIFKVKESDGFIPLSTNHATPVTIQLADANGNVSSVQCWLKQTKVPETPILQGGEVVAPTATYKVDEPDFQLTIPAMALYDTIRFEWVRMDNRSKDYAPRIAIHTDCEPVQYNMDINLKTIGLPDSLRDKALLVRLASNGRFYAEGGRWKDGWLLGHARNFGIFTVWVDDKPPTIRPLSLPRPGSVIQFKISDDLSGIEGYDAWIDDQWFLLEYDAKNDLLKGHIPGDLPMGEHLFKLAVWDERGNIANYENTFKR